LKSRQNLITADSITFYFRAMISQPMTDTAHKDGGGKLSGQDIEVSLDWPQRSGDNHV